MSNTFGQLFRVTTFGESHGGGVGVVIDGCPPRVQIAEADVQRELDRRRPGQSKLTTQRKEEDRCEILSGVFQGKTLGTPIAILVRNKDARPEDYSEIARKFRPSHADFTYEAKYGIRNWQGGGRASARETVGRVAAGAIAKKILSTFYAEFDLVVYVAEIHDVTAEIDRSTVRMKDVEKNSVRCPDAAAAKRMISLIERIRDEGDSVGGVIECVARGIPPGLGEPVFDKLEADLAKAMLSIPAAKGFEIGSGFAATQMQGSQHNDAFEIRDGRIRTKTNQLRRRPRRDQQRRRHLLSRCVQAARNHCAPTENRHQFKRTGQACRPWTPRSVCSPESGAHRRGDGRARPLRSRAAAARDPGVVANCSKFHIARCEDDG